MLLFTVGLEFTPDRLRRMRRVFRAGGGLQVLMTIGAVAGVLAGLGTPPRRRRPRAASPRGTTS